jgi:hypothetical protein
MQKLKFIASCVFDTLVVVHAALFRKLRLPDLDENTEAFYHK